MIAAHRGSNQRRKSSAKPSRMQPASMRRIEIQYEFDQVGIVDISWKGQADAYGTRLPKTEKDSA